MPESLPCSSENSAASSVPESIDLNPSPELGVTSDSITLEDNPFMRIMGRLIYAEACRYDYR